MPTGPKKIENRGGYRPGSGRKKETLSQQQVSAMLKKAKKWAKEQGKTLDDILLEIIYTNYKTDIKIVVKDVLAALKLFKDFTMAKLQEKDVKVTKVSAPVVLPERRQDPAKLVSIKGGKEKDRREK